MDAYNHEALYKATREQLCDVMDDWLHEVKRYDPDMYERLEADLYEKVYGQHFNRDRYDRAMDRRHYRNGRQSPKWTIEQVSDYARRNGDRFERYNEYDLAYEMNSIYEDYSDTVGENPENYYRMARQKLDNRDEPEGRAWRDYCASMSYDRKRDREGRFSDRDGRGSR